MIKCPNCGTEGPEDGPPEIVRQKFYPLKHAGYFVCLECTRRFCVPSNIRVS